VHTHGHEQNIFVFVLGSNISPSSWLNLITPIQRDNDSSTGLTISGYKLTIDKSNAYVLMTKAQTKTEMLVNRKR